VSLLDLLGGRPLDHVSIHVNAYAPEFVEPSEWEMTVWRLTGAWHGEPAPKPHRCFWNECGKITMHPNTMELLKAELVARSGGCSLEGRDE
jgi:hypothetical protein